jgi:hypothetical protein
MTSKELETKLISYLMSLDFEWRLVVQGTDDEEYNNSVLFAKEHERIVAKNFFENTRNIGNNIP